MNAWLHNGSEGDWSTVESQNGIAMVGTNN
jgi:hypothetical protein